jgi:hypothetical protein
MQETGPQANVQYPSVCNTLQSVPVGRLWQMLEALWWRQKITDKADHSSTQIWRKQVSIIERAQAMQCPAMPSQLQDVTMAKMGKVLKSMWWGHPIAEAID